MLPDNLPDESFIIASRIRWVMNQAVFGATPYLRAISLAAIPFLFAHISKNTNSQIRKDTLEPWKTVPVVTENCERQSRHFQTRRSETEPRVVLRETPLSGFRK